MHITFDTLAMVQKLESRGFTRQQSEEVINVIRDIHDDLVTKRDLDISLALLKKDILIGVGIMVASATGIVATLLKLF